MGGETAAMTLKCEEAQIINQRTGVANPYDESITGVCVRAQLPDGSWEPVDIACLDAPSLLAWLRSRGGHNPYAEDVVGHLLGHSGSLSA